MHGQLMELEQRLSDIEIDRNLVEREAARSQELLAEQREQTNRIAQEAFLAGTQSAPRQASRLTSAAPSPRQSIGAGALRTIVGSAVASGKPQAAGNAEMLARALDPAIP